MATVISGLVCLYPMQIFGIFTDDTALLGIGVKYIPIAVLLFCGSALRAIMNAHMNGSGNYKINFATVILDGIIFRIGLPLFSMHPVAGKCE